MLQFCLSVETDASSLDSPFRSSPESVWPKRCLCLWACLPSAGCQVMSSTCTAPTTMTRWTPRWATSSPACVLAFWPSPTPVWTLSPSTWWAKASANTSGSSSCAALLRDDWTVRAVGAQILPPSEGVFVFRHLIIDFLVLTHKKKCSAVLPVTFLFSPSSWHCQGQPLGFVAHFVLTIIHSFIPSFTPIVTGYRLCKYYAIRAIYRS